MTKIADLMRTCYLHASHKVTYLKKSGAYWLIHISYPFSDGF
ncbi:MAG: hypothetical protein ACKVOR_07320 [Flavobacteriales bacterium]